MPFSRAQTGKIPHLRRHSGDPHVHSTKTARPQHQPAIRGHTRGQVWVGQLGGELTTEQGKQAARAVAIDLMATLQAACGGDLSRVKRIVKLVSLVNSTASFTEQHLVTNGASELLVEVFGEVGKHARSAFGVAQLPLGSCVEIEMVAELVD